jgi:hypothetical protein
LGSLPIRGRMPDLCVPCLFCIFFLFGFTERRGSIATRANTLVYFSAVLYGTSIIMLQTVTCIRGLLFAFRLYSRPWKPN